MAELYGRHLDQQCRGKSPLKQLQPDHPICRGWNEYELHDEFYLNPTIADKATPLLQVTVKGTPVVVGWAYERPDGGRSFATTLGHFYRNFQQDDFRRMIVNAILWSAQVEISQSGSTVNLSEEHLILPPNPRK
jgi:type 1 glutamine amidotransferase